MRFADLNLIEPLLRAVAEEGYDEPTPVQVRAIPEILAGRDLLGIAQTGTGKTAAFALPILQRLAAAAPLPAGTRRPVRVLVLTPTRELASQIGESFATYGRHVPVRHTVVFGGVGMGPQVQALTSGVDVLVATPGRLLDLMGRRAASFQHLEIFVLDEADRMLDMGFLPAVQRVIAALPRRRQTLFFSATMPADAQGLADRLLHAAARVEVTPPATTVEKVAQVLHHVDRAGKQALLERLLDDPRITRALVFTRTKHGANKVVQRLERAGYDADAIHANKSQRQRERALAAFKSGMSRILVATDIAARGIDVDDISHVINFDLPNVAESYVHRIGRTARGGAEGAAISFCDPSERAYVRLIEREIRMRIPVADGPPPGTDAVAPGTAVDAPAHRRPARGPHRAARGPAPATPRGPGFGVGLGDGGGEAGPASDGRPAAGSAPTSETHDEASAPDRAGSAPARGSHPAAAGERPARPPRVYGRAGRRDRHPQRGSAQGPRRSGGSQRGTAHGHPFGESAATAPTRHGSGPSAPHAPASAGGFGAARGPRPEAFPHPRRGNARRDTRPTNGPFTSPTAHGRPDERRAGSARASGTSHGASGSSGGPARPHGQGASGRGGDDRRGRRRRSGGPR